MSRITRPSWYDFQRVSKQDLGSEQSSYLNNNAATTLAALGTGVKLSSAIEPVIFDSDNLDSTQSGYVAVTAFDGRGILTNPYTTSDQVEGNQISVTISDARLSGFLNTTVTLFGQTFDDQLIYEHIILTDNGTEVSRTHFKEITNIMFQNLRGNTNTILDGYGSRNVGGTLVITEASSFKVSRDLIASEQIAQPDMVFRNYKVYDSGKLLETVIQEAIGVANDINDLDINTTGVSTREFAQGAATDIIYGQKFKMKGNNIQKISLLLSVETAGTWSGTLVVGIRPLQTSQTYSTEFLPSNEINFDPDTVPIEEIAVSANDILDSGVILTTEPQIVDFLFTSSSIANPALSNMEEDKYYVITIRRTGSTSTNTIILEESVNSDTEKMLVVFDSSIWTDVPDSTLWYQVWSDSVKVASGAAFDQGSRITVEKTEIDSDGARVQRVEENLVLATTSEGSQNYLVVQKTTDFLLPESHPRTGDLIFSTEQDIPLFSTLNPADVVTLIATQPDLLFLAKIIDNNPRSNPAITGTLTYPALARGNTIHVINPDSDLLQQNVIGSIITPNAAKPGLRYRITSQETFDDLYGDVDGDGIIDLNDVARMSALDGYARDLSSGTVLAATQLAAIQNDSVSILEILRADVNESTDIDGAGDLAELNAYLTTGAGFSGGSGFTRVTLQLEPLTSPELYMDADAASTLQIEVEDPDLIDNVSFTALDFEIEFVPTWTKDNIEITDLRRFSCSVFTEDTVAGGINNFFIPGDLYLGGKIANLDSTGHTLDYEEVMIELELPSGDTVGEVNMLESFVVGKLKFSDGTFVAASAIATNQIGFAVSIASHVKNVLDGYDYDGYVDFTGLGADADEVIGTYMDHTSGILRINAYNIVRNEFYPQIRTRILVKVSLKKAGFTNSPVYVSSTDLASVLI